MEHENNYNYASKGLGTTAVTLGSVALGLEVLRGGSLGGILNGNNACEGDHPVTRREAELNATIAALDTKNKLLESNIYTDSKLADVYEKLSARIGLVEGQVSAQAVVNAQITANLSCMQNTINGLAALTKTVIPITNVCPEPMAKFNSWTAPTTTTTP
jgi:hypothetical protein